MTGRRTVRATLGACLAAVALTASAAPAPAGAHGPREADAQLLARVRQATAQFHDVRRAVAASYVPTEHCTEEPGLGGMGLHYVNFGLVVDEGVVEAERPEVLLYAPMRNGKLRLVAVEYLVPAADWSSATAPNLFGVPFDGPMDEHEPNTTGDHYDQHAWIWMHNPDGVLAAFNPALTCTP